MSDKTTYYERNRKMILNRAKEYYKNNNNDYEIKQEINRDNYLKKKRM